MKRTPEKRTNVAIPEGLHRELLAAKAYVGKSIQTMAEEALRGYIRKVKSSREAELARLANEAFGGGMVRPSEYKKAHT